MSRTDKDRPYWVRCNDPKQEGRNVVHNHELFGRPIYHSRVKKDANGEVVTETRPVWVPGRKIYHYADGHVQEVKETWYAKPAFYDAAELLHVIYEPSGHVYREFPTYERVEVGHYPVTCTADRPRVPYRRNLDKIDDATCWVELEHYVVKPWRHRPTKKAKRAYHSGARANERDNSRLLAKTYNAGEDVEEFDWENGILRQQRHVGWWD